MQTDGIQPIGETKATVEDCHPAYYNLTEILSEDSAAYARFMQQVFTLLGAPGAEP